MIKALLRAKALTARIFRRAGQANISMAAAGVAFYGFLSVFPAIAFIIALWRFAANPEAIRREMALLAELLPPDAFSLISSQVEALLSAPAANLGWASLVSLLIAFWSARAGVAGLISGLNAVHHRPDHGSLHGTLLALVLTLVLVAIALAALIAAVVVPLVLALIPIGRVAMISLDLANTVLTFFLMLLGLAVTYRFGPNRAGDHRPRLFTLGLLVAVFLWFIASRGFVIYLANFNTYNRVYGSIGAVVILQMWLYLSALAVLFGAAVDAQRAEDITEARQKQGHGQNGQAGKKPA